MFQIIDIILLVIKGLIRVSTPTQPASTYRTGLNRYPKSYFDEHYQYSYSNTPINNLPVDIKYYEKNIGNRTLRKIIDTKFFEIYETSVISDKELAMNVRLAYEDMVMTGLSSSTNSVVTENHIFILFINDRLKRLEIRTLCHTDLKSRNLKKDFGDYLFKHILESLRPISA